MLDEHQTLAAQSTAAVMSCVASPGSGKSRTLIGRIQWLIEQGCSPRHIVALTYTNAAARVIEDRLSGAEPVTLGFAGTLHAFCLTYIRHNSSQLGLPSQFAVADETEADAVLEEVIKRNKYKGSKEVIGQLVESGFKPHPSRPNAEQIVTLDYAQTMLGYGLVDFGMILSMAAKLFSRGISLPIPCTHLLVDEIQDSSEIDATIYDLWPAKTKWYTGDFDQSLYSFRGGSPKFLLDTARVEAPTHKTFLLSHTYRCLPRICEIANNLIRHNPDRIPKEMSTVAAFAGKVVVHHYENASIEIHAIAQKIVERKTPHEEVAVLLRTNYLVKQYSDGLRAAGIPVKQKIVKPVPKDWPLARTIVSLCANPDNDRLMFKLLQHQFGEPEAKKIRVKAAGGMTSLNQYLKTLERGGGEVSIKGDPLEALSRHGICAESIDLVEAVKKMLPDGSDAMALSLELARMQERDTEEGTGVTVCTMHRSKGGEWSDVFLPAFEDEIIPGNKEEDTQENRRVAYVGITRAKQFVHISWCAERIRNEWMRKAEKATPSRFIEEAGLE